MRSANSGVGARALAGWGVCVHLRGVGLLLSCIGFFLWWGKLLLCCAAAAWLRDLIDCLDSGSYLRFTGNGARCARNSAAETLGGKSNARPFCVRAGRMFAVFGKKPIWWVEGHAVHR
jgi:hypothetical protein